MVNEYRATIFYDITYSYENLGCEANNHITSFISIGLNTNDKMRILLNEKTNSTYPEKVFLANIFIWFIIFISASISFIWAISKVVYLWNLKTK